jgi:hypothetical protein
VSEAPRCETCQHWAAKPTKSRGTCVLGEIDYPWCFNTCARYLGPDKPAPAAPTMQSQARGFWPYVPGVVKP